MFNSDVHYQRLIVAERQEYLRRVAGKGRLRRQARQQRRHTLKRPDRPG
jgi:hypothetical protein